MTTGDGRRGVAEVDHGVVAKFGGGVANLLSDGRWSRGCEPPKREAWIAVGLPSDSPLPEEEEKVEAEVEQDVTMEDAEP